MRYSHLAFTLVLVIITTISSAQPQPPDPAGDPDNPVPITGLAYLAIAGGAYGIHRLSKKKNKINEKA